METGTKLKIATFEPGKSISNKYEYFSAAYYCTV